MSTRIWDGDTCLSALEPVDFVFCCGGGLSCDVLGRCGWWRWRWKMERRSGGLEDMEEVWRLSEGPCNGLLSLE